MIYGVNFIDSQVYVKNERNLHFSMFKVASLGISGRNNCQKNAYRFLDIPISEIYLCIPSNENLNPCANNGCTTSGSATSYRFGGLSLSTFGNALLDGTTDNSNWFYALGTNYHYGVGIPSWPDGPDSGSSRFAQLYVCVGTTEECPPGITPQTITVQGSQRK